MAFIERHTYGTCKQAAAVGLLVECHQVGRVAKAPDLRQFLRGSIHISLIVMKKRI